MVSEYVLSSNPEIKMGSLAYYAIYRDGLYRGKDMQTFSGFLLSHKNLGNIIVAPLMALSHHSGMIVWFARGAIFLSAALIVT